MASELVLHLIDHGFFSALGTTQWSGGRQSENVVGTETAFTYDTNNGVLVVYDDLGRPWIRSRSRLEPHWDVRFVEKFGLKRGAFVPHSNDGGIFKRMILEQTRFEI